MKKSSNNDLLEITNKTLRYRGQVFQITNLTRVAKYRLKKNPLIRFFSFIIRIITLGIVRPKKEFVLYLETNSGSAKLFSSKDEDFIDKLVLTLADIMENQEQNASYTVKIKSAKIQNNAIGEAIMGDKFENISHSTIVNKSQLSNALNQVNSGYGKEAEAALKEIADHISKYNNTEAAELFNSFNEQIAKSNANKTILRALWEGFTKNLPDAARVVSAVATITKILI